MRAYKEYKTCDKNIFSCYGVQEFRYDIISTTIVEAFDEWRGQILLFLQKNCNVVKMYALNSNGCLPILKNRHNEFFRSTYTKEHEFMIEYLQ